MGDVFKALADPTRRAILDDLAEKDGQTLFELCGRLVARRALSRQAVSQHLMMLEESGLVEIRREGRCKFHYLNSAPLEDLVTRWLKPPAPSPPPQHEPPISRR